MPLQRICVYLGSSPGRTPAYTEAARQLARALAARGLGLVYGGASVGTMGVIADAALEAGAEVIGVIPESLQTKELGHTGLTELHVVANMHERKLLMMDLADGFMALPGGSGTFEELFETFTWLQLGLHRKPVGLLDVEGYWGPLIAMMEHAVNEGFVRPEHARMLLDVDDPDLLLDAMAAWTPPDLPKWVDRDDA